MQALNLQAPKTSELEATGKAKGTQSTKKAPSKKAAGQAQKTSFKDMVDQSARQETQVKDKTTQSTNTAQDAGYQQNRAQQTDAMSLEEAGRADERESVRSTEAAESLLAFAQGNPIEASWLQGALQGQSAQEQSTSDTMEMLGDEEIAFLKADPLFDEDLLSQAQAANLLTGQVSLAEQEGQSGGQVDDAFFQIADTTLKEGQGKQVVPEGDEDSWLLQQEESTPATLFVSQDGKLKQGEDLNFRKDSQDEVMLPLAESPFVLSEERSAAASGEDNATRGEALSVQNELLGGLFTVTDLRPASQKGERIAQSDSSGEAQVAQGKPELTLELSIPQTTSMAEHVVLKQTGDAPSFTRLLSQQLRTSAPDFAKAGAIVLRGENEGTIKLALRPESLGNVKINLQLSDNVITGKIAVASKEAFEAFKQNIDAFRQAFCDSGFEGAEFTLSYFESSSGFAQESGGQNDGRFLSSKAYADYVSGEDGTAGAAETQVFAVDADKKVNVIA